MSNPSSWTLQLRSTIPVEVTQFELLPSRKLRLGRTEEVELVLPIPGISREHALLLLEEDQLKVVDLGSTNGTFINDERVAEASARPGDILRFGDVCFEVCGPLIGSKTNATMVLPEVSPPPENATQQVTLHGFVRGLSEPITAQAFPLSEAGVTVGRSSDNDLVIEHVSVSGKHAYLSCSEGNWWLEDLNSTNGSSVDGAPVSGRVPLMDGQRIGIAQVEMELHLHGQAPSESIVTPSADAIIPRSVEVSIAKSQLPGRRSLLLGLLLASCLLLLTANPPPWLRAWLPQYEVIADLQDYAYELTEEPVNSPITLTATWPAQSLPNHSRLLPPSLGDLNGDGYLDILLADAQGRVRLLDGRSGGSLMNYQSGAELVAGPIAMPMQEGGMAVVIAHYQGQVEGVSLAGERLWLSSAGYELGQLLHRPQLVDVNSDGRLDILVATEKRGLVALDGAREGWLLWDTARWQQGQSTQPLLADINADQQLEYVTATDQGQVLAISIIDGVPVKLWEQQLAPIVFAAPTHLWTGPEAHSLVLVTAPQQATVALRGQTGSPLWQRPQTKLQFASPLGADFNGDGHMDAVKIDYDGTLLALDGRSGAALWQRQLGAEVQASPLLHDFNQDGSVDVLVADVEGGLHIVNGADGRMLLEGYSVAGSDGITVSPLLGDLNGDGQMDLLLLSQNGLVTSLTLNRRLRASSAPWPVALGNDQHGLLP